MTVTEKKIKIRSAVLNAVKFAYGATDAIQPRDIDIRKCPKNGFSVTVHCCPSMSFFTCYLNSCLEMVGLKADDVSRVLITEVA